MVTVKQGNLLEAKEDIICQQVNIQGIMGRGVARQLADKYKGLEESYSQYCKKHNNRHIDLSADIYYYNAEDKIIANMFSQKENFDTDYLNMEIALTYLKSKAKNMKKSIAMPYRNTVVGIANGEWNEVYKIIEKVFSDYDVTLYKLER